MTHGVSVEAFHCALDPRKLEHVLLPELGVAITVAAEPHVASVSHPCQVIDMNECVDRENAAQYAGLAAYNQRLCLELIDQAVAALARAKKLHDLLETYYIPNMDFAAINTVRERTLARILRYAAEFA